MPETQKVHNVFEMKVAYITLGYVICMQSSVASCFAYRFVFFGHTVLILVVIKFGAQE